MKSTARLAREQEAMRNRAAAQEQEANRVTRGPLPPEAKVRGTAMWGLDEPPYTVGEVAQLLGIDRGTAARLFDGEEGVLIFPSRGRGIHKMRRIPRPVFNRVLNLLSQPKTESPYYPIKFRQPVVHMLEYPQKARKYTEEDRRKMSEVMRRVHARKAAKRAAWAAEKAAKKAQTPRAVPVPLTPN